MLMLTITNEQKVVVTLAPKTAAGNDAQVDTTNGVPAWTVTSGDAQVVPAADGLSAEVISGEANVVSTIEVTADADLGEGVTNIGDSITLTVVAAGADNLGFSPGIPTLK